MARLAIRVSLIHRETDIIVLKLAVAFKGDTTRALSILAIDARRQKWIATFGAEEMVFVVCTFAKLRVVQSDEPLVHNGSLTMIAPRRKALVVIEMAVRFAIALVRANVFEKAVTVRTPEAARVPSDTHCTDDTSHNRAATAPTRKPTAATRG